MDNLNADSEVLYTIAEVASLLKVNKNMVYQLINKGYLRSIKFGCRKVTRKALLDFLEKYDGEDIFASTENGEEWGWINDFPQENFWWENRGKGFRKTQYI